MKWAESKLQNFLDLEINCFPAYLYANTQWFGEKRALLRFFVRFEIKCGKQSLSEAFVIYKCESVIILYHSEINH